ncbi:WG repeat-containing protein [Paenibacillus rhizovicinus]|uniref:WG repeat-containing protein n=1 Tax=Paenibacillus rhizovicinus TaxID=2704463 RepID=A0A6C0P5W6_9BACL|nr:WG repeat-containing protein [Paenibacillus rhizovicinus]QHW33950.1 WG repeat-containing protein [Paenibacillus rhizovicinus]
MNKRLSITLFVIIFAVAAIITGFIAGNKKKDAGTILYPVQVEGKWGYVNNKGKIVIKPTYAWADDFHEGVAVVELAGHSDGRIEAMGDEDVKYGAIDTTGKMVVKPDYSFITKYNEGVAGAIIVDEVTYDLQYFILDNKGKILYTLPSDMQIDSMLFNGTGTPTQSEGLILVQDDKTEKYGYIDRYGKFVLPYQYFEANSFSEGLALVKNDKNQYQYVDKTGKVIIDASKYSSGKNFSEGLAAVAVQDKETSTVKFGYIDKQGHMKIKPQFAKAYAFSEGLAKVCAGDSINDYSIGYIDESGAYKVAPSLKDHYDETLFSEGLAPIADGAGGYVNKNGQLIIHPVIPKDDDNYIKHSMAGEFRNGIAKVTLSDGRIGYIDTTGTYIWDPRN